MLANPPPPRHRSSRVPLAVRFEHPVAALVGLLLLGLAVLGVPHPSRATPVTSAANLPYSGTSPGGVTMATGELTLALSPDLRLDGPVPVEFARYYGSMLSQEGFAAAHLGPNWLGTYDWSVSQSPVSGIVSVVTNRGQRIQFQPGPTGGYTLLQPTDQMYRLDVVGATWRFTHPGLRRVYIFDSISNLLVQILEERGNALSLNYTGVLLTQVSDGLGRAITFTYDTSDRVIQASDGTRRVVYGYNGAVLATVTDAAGRDWTHTYVNPGPSQGLLTGITEPLGNTPVTQAYDALGRVASQMDAAGGNALYEYDAPTGATFTDPLGNAWTYRHDAGGRLESLIDPATGATSFEYDALGRLTSVTRPRGDVASIDYDPVSGYPNRWIVPGPHLFECTYGAHFVGGPGGPPIFDLASASYPDGTNESYGRDAAGNPTDFKDRSGLHWLRTYNSRGQPLTYTNPSQGVTTLTYDAQGRLATAQDHATNTTQFGYDGLGRLTQVTWPGGTGRQYGYDALDHQTSLTDERGKVWSTSFDENGRLASVTNPLLETTTWVHDPLDRMTQVVDPLGHAHTYAYDGAGRVSSETDRSSRTTTYQYDTLGRLTGVVDPAGGTDTYGYDGNSRLTSMQDPLTHMTLIGYDDLDNVTSVTDPMNTQVTYGYDSMWRRTSATAPLGHTEAFSYDPRGLLTSFTNVTSVTGWPRTSLGEVAQVTDPNGNGWPRGYDQQGRLTSAVDPLTRTSGYQYDALNRLTQIMRSDGSTKQFAYDAVGRLTGESYTGGPALTYGYDDANRLTGATGASFAYDAAGRMTSSNGIAMTYDDAGRLVSQTLAPGMVVGYAYDSRGLLSEVTDWLGGTTSFSYDTARRLTGTIRPNGTTGTCGYDDAGQVISKVDKQPGPTGLPPLSSITITRDALGRPASIDRRQPLMPVETKAASGSFSYDVASQLNGVGHDPLGRTTAEGSRTFQWDGASRLTHYAAGADSPRFTYDAFGMVLTRTLGPQTEQFVWNHATKGPAQSTKLPAGAELRLFVHAPSGLLLYSVNASTGARLFYHYDEAGNTIFLTNDAGSVVTTYAYKPFGDVTALGQTADNRFTFGAAGGMMALGSSGLWAVGPSVYDDRTMRVISELTTHSWLGDLGVVGDISSFYQDRIPNEDVLRTGNERESSAGSAEPNQVSVMNYNYQLKGILHWSGDEIGGLDYSSGLGGAPAAAMDGSGGAELGGGDFSASLGKFRFGRSDGRIQQLQETSGTMMHELGHTLGLCHAGPASIGEEDPTMIGSATGGAGVGKINLKPNFVGSMGYLDKSTIGSATGGAGGGKIKFDEFTIKKTSDKASPNFFKNCCAGAHYKKVLIDMRKSGGDPASAGKPFLKFKFATVFTTKIDWSGPGDEGPEESITFVYGKLGAVRETSKPPSDYCLWCVR